MRAAMMGRTGRFVGGLAVAALVLVGASCAPPPPPPPCSGAVWCLLPDTGLTGGFTVPTSVTDAGNVAVASSGTGPLGPDAPLFLFDRATGTYRELGTPGQSQTDGTVSPDGRWAAVVDSSAAGQTVTLVDLQSNTSRTIASFNPPKVWDPTFSAGLAPAAAPYVSPDGQYVVWSQIPGGPLTILDVHVWSVASQSDTVAFSSNLPYATSLDSAGFYFEVAGGPLYYDFATRTQTNAPPRAHPAPPRSSVDGRWWLGGTTSVLLVDETTSTSVDLGLPPGWDTTGRPPRAVISGDGHHVVVGDTNHIWIRDV